RGRRLRRPAALAGDRERRDTREAENRKPPTVMTHVLARPWYPLATLAENQPRRHEGTKARSLFVKGFVCSCLRVFVVAVTQAYTPVIRTECTHPAGTSPAPSARVWRR